MIICPTHIPDLLTINFEPINDFRGSFIRSFCFNEMANAGITFDIAQTNVSTNYKSGTLRGLHYQGEPKPESKIITCTRGAIFDVIVDLRESSPTFCQWFSKELTYDNNIALCVPPGCAHGFITLEDNSVVNYLMNEFYNEDLSLGVRWDDPNFSIKWPRKPLVISERDASYPDFYHNQNSTNI